MNSTFSQLTTSIFPGIDDMAYPREHGHSCRKQKFYELDVCLRKYDVNLNKNSDAEAAIEASIRQFLELRIR